jgi:hypothetical protein
MQASLPDLHHHVSKPDPLVQAVSLQCAGFIAAGK